MDETKSAKKPPGKVAMAFGYLIVFAIIVVVIWGIVVLSSGHKKATKSVSSINSQAASMLTTATNHNVQLMTTGQQDAVQPGALNMNPPSPFEQWRNIVDKPNASSTNTNTYNKVAALYKSNQRSLPSAVTRWHRDDENTYADIGVWQLAEDTLLVGKSTNSVSDGDQQAVNAAYQAYQKDLSKAQADIKELY